MSPALRHFDGALCAESGPVRFRLQDRDIAGDEGLPFTRDLADGQLTLTVEFDAPGSYVLIIEPPLLADMQMSEPVRIEVE